MNRSTLLLVAGSSGSGKTTLVNALRDTGRVRLAPKYSTRHRRPSDGLELISVSSQEGLPATCDIRYRIYGVDYGIDTELLRRLLFENSTVALVTGAFEVLQRLKSKFAPDAKVIWIESDLLLKQIATSLEETGVSQAEIRQRLATLETQQKLYDGNRSLFDFTVVNNGSVDWMVSQVRAFLDSLSVPALELLYSNEGPKKEFSQIQNNLVLANAELKSYLARHPSLLYQLSPREFEVLVAEIMRDLGYVVEVTPRVRDGGFDIRLVYAGGVAPWLCLVECKRYAPNRPVGVEVVRNLHAVRDIERANGSAIITTSYFSKAAWNLQRQLGYQMSLHDYDNLRNWLARYQLLLS